MDFLLIGTITTIKPIKYGLLVKIRETKVGGISKNGHEIGTLDYTWDCVANNTAIVNYINKFFRVGAKVKVKGVEVQSATNDEKVSNFHSITRRIESLDLFNMADPKKKQIRERYNTKVVGEERPNIDNDFDDDFE